MTDNLALANTDNHPLMQILHNPSTIKRFELACGRQAGSVMINIINAANMNPSIWECEPNSVITAALNVSALGLSLAPGVGQACVLPFNKNKKVGNEWTSEKRAQAVIMLRGVKDMAMRTNKYRVLNAFMVYEGQEWVEDQRTGIGNPTGPIKNKKNVIGYGAYLLLYKGYEATVYKTKDEILAHAMQYSPTFDKQKQVFKPGSRWIEHFDEQALKTVMKDLIMNHGEISASDRAALEMVESDSVPESAMPDDTDTVDGKVEYVGGEYDQTPPEPKATPAPVPATTPAQEAPSAPAGKKVLTYGIAKEYNVGGKRLDDRTIDELQVMAEDKNKAPSTQTAIRVVLDYKVSQAMNAEKKE